MTLTQARKLKVGDKILWPAGANGCAESIGTVCKDEKYHNLFVEWPDTPDQRTYLHDKAAVKFLKFIEAQK